MQKVSKVWFFLSLLLIVPGLLFGQWVFNSFDEDPYWGGSQVDRDENLDEGERAIISYESAEVMFGEAAMRIDYYALGGRGAYLPHLHWDSLGVYDFSGYDSLIFWYFNDLARFPI